MTGSWLDVPLGIGLMVIGAASVLFTVALVVAAAIHDIHDRAVRRRRAADDVAGTIRCQRTHCRREATHVTAGWATCIPHIPQVGGGAMLSDLEQWDADARREAGA